MEPVTGLLLGAISLAILASARKQPLISYPVVEGGKVSSPYKLFRGTREPGHKYGEKIYHLGIDIKAPKGSKIRAVNNGFILALWKDGKVTGYGNTVLIKHRDGSGSLYGHLNKFAPIKVNQNIRKGQVIGYVGKTQAPRSEMRTAPHLHLEVHKISTKRVNPTYPPRLDPLAYLKKQGMRVG